MYCSEDAMIQNLKDAGCDAQVIQEFRAIMLKGKKPEGLRLLEQHRHTLLEALHTDQKRIDCLDYLVYQLKKEK